LSADILTYLGALIIEIISTTGYFGITVLMTLESACIPVPSEIIMPFSGFLVFEGRFALWLVVVWGTIGNLIGSIIAYLIGFYGGRPLFKKWGRYLLISSGDLERADRWFRKYGQPAVFFGRLLPIIRTFISLPAGLSRMNFKKFSFYTLAGSLPWSFALTYAGLIMGRNWSALEVFFKKFDLVIGGLIIFLIAWWLWRHFREESLPGR